MNLLSRFTGLFGTKSALVSPDAAAWARGDDVTLDGQGAKLTSPYAQSAWVYCAINALAANVAQIPFRVSRVAGGARKVRSLMGSADPRHKLFVRRNLAGDILESGEVVELFERPHPLMDRQLFWEMVVTWLALRGEFFILPTDAADSPVDLTARGARVQRLITLPTELFWHIIHGYDLDGWRYTGSPLLTPIPSEILLPGEVIHSRTPNPYLFWRGMSPLLVAATAAGADYAAAKYSQGYWVNNADTGVIVTTDQQATPEQRIAILAALRERKRKAGTADRPLFLWGGAKVEKPQLNGMEAQFIQNRHFNRQEIGAIFRVPDAAMGFTESKANALSGGGQAIGAEMLSFISYTIAPICARLEAALAPVVATFGPDLVGWFDLDSLPVMQEARRARLDSAAKAFALGAAFNDINALYDLGFPEYKYGKDNFLPFGLQNLSEPAEPLPSEDTPAPDTAETEDDDAPETGEATADETGEDEGNPFDKMARLLRRVAPPAPACGCAAPRAVDTSKLWRSHVAARRASVKLCESKVRKVLHKYRGLVLAKLHEAHLSKGAETRSLVDIIFSPHGFGMDLAAALDNPLRAALQAAGVQVLGEIGKLHDPWEMPPRQVSEYLQGRTQPILGTGDTVRRRINTALTAGAEAGETTAELAARVREVFNAMAGGDDGMTMSDARRVAQTEVAQAYNYSRHETMAGVGIGYKCWLSSHGPTVRPAHRQAESDYGEIPIPLGEPFIVMGERMLFPGDSSLGASAENVINCQCIQLAVEKRGENAWRIYGLGSGAR